MKPDFGFALLFAALAQGYGFFKKLLSNQRDLCGSRVTLQIITWAVSTAHDFNPALWATNIPLRIIMNTNPEAERNQTYIWGFGFSVPAVAGVVSHLIVHVLSETQLVFGNADFSQVEVDPPNKISQDWIIDHSLNQTGKSSFYSNATETFCTSSIH